MPKNYAGINGKSLRGTISCVFARKDKKKSSFTSVESGSRVARVKFSQVMSGTFRWEFPENSKLTKKR